MKPIYLAFIFLLISVSCWANKIDDLRTDKDVIAFVNTLIKKSSRPAFFRSNEQTAKDELAQFAKAPDWQKADVNGDGSTDLLVNIFADGFRSLVIISDGKRSYRLYPLEYNGAGLVTSVNIDGRARVLFYNKRSIAPSPVSPDHLRKDTITIDTLIYKFDSFIEYNVKPSKKEIASVAFKTSRCFGSCPVFSIDLKIDGQANYIGADFNEDKGTFKGNISSKNLKPFLDLINYINVDKLKDNYTVDWTDQPTYWLTVNFKDGSTKTIRDYGVIGTFGLRRLYAMFFKLKKEQVWYE